MACAAVFAAVSFALRGSRSAIRASRPSNHNLISTVTGQGTLEGYSGANTVYT